MKDKNQIYFSVCCAVLKLELDKGHLAWNLSEVSKVSGITRSLIYYYFGKEKEPILIEAFYFISNVFFNSVMDEKRSGSVVVRLKKALAQLENMPFIFSMYYLHKNQPTQFGEVLRKAEQDFLKYLNSLYPGKSRDYVFQIYLKELGAIAYHLNPNEVEKYF
jgi:hypothetical protein